MSGPSVHSADGEVAERSQEVVVKRGGRQATKSRKRVLILDVHPLVREGLALLISQQRGLETCAMVGTVEDGVRAIRDQKPDIVLLDLSLEEGSGLELLKYIQAESLKLPVLVLSMHDEGLCAERALQAGAQGYLMKGSPSSVLINAIEKVLLGEIYVSDHLKERMLSAVVGKRHTADSAVDRLSRRELEVLDMIARGLGTQEIAENLQLSVKTIACYRQGIRAKLGLKNTTELTRYAIFWAAGKGPP